MSDSIYRTLYLHSMDAIFLTSPDGSIFAANPAACEMFRMTEAQLCRHGRSGLVDEDDAAFHAYLEERARKGKARRELTFIRGDGSRFFGEASSGQFTDDAGKLRAALIIRDVTERKRMEDELSESQVLLNAIIDSTEDLVCAVDMRSLTLLSFNRGMYDYFKEQRGIEIEKGMSFDGLVHSSSSAEQWRGFLDRALRDGSFSTEYATSSGGHVLQLNFHAFEIDDDGCFGVSIFGREISEHKRAEAALRDSEERYRTIFENSPVGLFRSTLDGRFIEANPALADIYGYDTPEAIIRDINDIGKQLYVDEADRHAVVARQMQAAGDSGLYVNRYRRRDGSECIANLYLKTIRDDDGKPVFFEGIVDDVTENKHAEEGLRASEARFRIFVDHVSDALFLHGEHGIILDANRQACETLGYSREELIGMSPARFDADLSQDDRKAIEERIIKGEVVTFESHHRRKDGSTFPVEVSIRPFMDGGRRVQISSARDITERKRAEDELRASEARFRIFVDHAMDAFFLHGKDGIVIDANHQACLSLGYTRDELLGMSPSQFDADLSDEARYAMRKRVSQGEVATFVSRHRRKDGSTFPVEVSVRTFSAGGPALQISTSRDISERLRVEGNLRGLYRELLAISHCHQTLLRVDEEQQLLNEICRIICDEAGYRMAWVGFVEQDKAHSIRPVAWAGHEEGYLANTRISWGTGTKSGRGPGGEAVRSGKVAYIQDIETDPRMKPWRDQALQFGYRSSIGIPLKTSDGEVFGLLSIYATERNAFVLEEIRLLEELAEDLAFGIDVLRMRSEREQVKISLQTRTEELYISNLQLRRLTAHREEIREQERMNIARNVHDELGQLLTALQIRLSTLALAFGKENKKLRKEIKFAQELTDKSLKAARDVISALRPASLDMGLAVSLEWLAQRYSANTGIRCDMELIDWQDEEVNEATLIALYRITQESLTNVARHARADRVTITLSGLDGACQLIVRDNGVGFEPDGIKEGSFGLIGIRERVAMLGGSFAIDSRKGKGTELRVTIPVPA